MAGIGRMSGSHVCTTSLIRSFVILVCWRQQIVPEQLSCFVFLPPTLNPLGINLAWLFVLFFSATIAGVKMHEGIREHTPSETPPHITLDGEPLARQGVCLMLLPTLRLLLEQLRSYPQCRYIVLPVSINWNFQLHVSYNHSSVSFVQKSYQYIFFVH